MNPEHIVLDLTDGGTLEAMIHVRNGNLHIDCGFLGTFIIHPKSARQVCHRITEMLTDAVEEGQLK
jgi:hypothetical protein